MGDFGIKVFSSFVHVRFVRFVSTPEVIERVYTLETEIIQIKEAIGIQNNCETALTVVSILGIFGYFVWFMVRTQKCLMLYCINRWEMISEQKKQRVRKVCYND